MIFPSWARCTCGCPSFPFWGRNCWDSALRAVLRLHEHPERLAAEADGQARYSCDGCALQRSTRMRSSDAHYIWPDPKNLSKFTGMLQAAWVQTRRVKMKSHRESYRLNLVVLVQWKRPRTSLVRQRLCKVLGQWRIVH